MSCLPGQMDRRGGGRRGQVIAARTGFLKDYTGALRI